MIYAHKIRSKDGIQEMLAYRFPELKGADVKPPDKKLRPHTCCLGFEADSSGPIIWLQNRLMESGQYYKSGGEDRVDLVEAVRVVGGKTYAQIARSKFWDRAPIDKVFPINKTTLQVAGLEINQQ